MALMQQAAREEQRTSILSQILEPAAKDRLKRLSLVKPEKARSVEDALVRAATSGQLKSKVNRLKMFLFVKLTLSQRFLRNNSYPC